MKKIQVREMLNQGFICEHCYHKEAFIAGYMGIYDGYCDFCQHQGFAFRYFSCDNNTRVSMEKFRILKFTPKGMWILGHNDKPRLVIFGTSKCFAHTTEQEAWESFKRRKKFHLDHLRIKVSNLKMLINRCGRVENHPAENESIHIERFGRYDDEL